ncbi:MAG: ABC transporter ATP-binding protein [Bacillota bacterium]|nr:ABC transporter ATP-binding protein [Bacillota bacterium]
MGALAEPLLSVKSLQVDYVTSHGTVRAVRDVSFDVNRGEVFALVGESGCGKSTSALALMRLVPPRGRTSAGHILFDGLNLQDLSERQMTLVRGKQIGMIFQNPLVALNPVYRSGYQIAEAVLLDNVSRQEAWRQALDIMGSVKIPDREERMQSYPHELSGGMRQRVMIGMMISRAPQLLIADEPTTSLDVTIQAQILDLLMDLKAKNNMSLLIITHDFGIVADIADRVGVMYAGSLVEQGDVFSIFENPRHPYTRLLMRALPTGTKAEGRLETIKGSVPSLVEVPAGCPFHPRCPSVREICSSQPPPEHEVRAGHPSPEHGGPSAGHSPSLDGPSTGHRVRCHFWED